MQQALALAFTVFMIGLFTFLGSERFARLAGEHDAKRSAAAKRRAERRAALRG